MTLQVKYLNPLTNLFIVRATRTHYRLVWGAITLITSIMFRKVCIRVLHVGGSIKSCQKATIQHDENLLALIREKAHKKLQKGKFIVEDEENLSDEEDFIAL